ncbi:hypothetical protein ACFQGE_06205 [Halomicroarcula sp. GCM10025817]|uniref:hypothetical protein n=1 Tax=Haloarcula TaxID=2237 RepID=UPI0023E8FAAD|nr:hypothetical protein [Halomicroarcula sp. SYNS111]
MDDDSAPLSVEELADYCRTQARFLWGRVESLTREANELLEALDEDIEEVRERLSERSSTGDARPVSPSAATGGRADADLAEIESLEDDIEEAQAVVAATQARRDAFERLATAYTDLADEVDSTASDGQTALTRVVEFERDHDAPAYFEDQRTLIEVVAESATSEE